ncbi:MAG: TlpA family protein disulfide reductase [Candidatus Sulfotelmatobacter sp.]
MFCVVLALLGMARTCAAQTGAASHQVFEVKIKKDVLQDLVRSGEASGLKGLVLPQFRIYNRKGQQVADLGGRVGDDFKERVEAALKHPSPTSSDKTLSWEVERIADTADTSFADADFTFVVYWAEWCKPCEAERKLMIEILNSHPELNVNVLHVEADPVKAFPDSHIVKPGS